MSKHLSVQRKMLMKKIILPISIAILAVAAVFVFRWQYDKYIEYKGQQEELQLIEQERKDNKKRVKKYESIEANLDSLWQRTIIIHKKEITIPVKYADFCNQLSDDIKEQASDHVVLADGETLYLNFVSADKDSRNSKSPMIYGISTEKNRKSSWLSIQQIKVGTDIDRIMEIYDQPVTNDDHANPSYMQYADVKSDMLLDDQNITLYYQNDLVSGISMYYDPSKDDGE